MPFEIFVTPIKRFIRSLSVNEDVVPKDVKVETGGTDGTLSKRIVGLTDVGQYSLNQMYEKEPTVSEPIRVELRDGRLLVWNIITNEKVEIGYRGPNQTIPGIYSDDVAPGQSSSNSSQLTRQALSLSEVSGLLATFSPSLNRWDGDTQTPIVPLDAINTNQNNYDVGTGSVFTVEYIGLTANATITGITKGVTGRRVTLINRGTSDVLLTHQDSASNAANRIVTPDGSTFTIGPNRSVDLIYDSALNRWRVLLN